jgi:hypothetical protein
LPPQNQDPSHDSVGSLIWAGQVTGRRAQFCLTKG